MRYYLAQMRRSAFAASNTNATYQICVKISRQQECTQFTRPSRNRKLFMYRTYCLVISITFDLHMKRLTCETEPKQRKDVLSMYVQDVEFHMFDWLAVRGETLRIVLCIIGEFGNRHRRRRKTKSLIRVVYKPTHTLLDINCLLKYHWNLSLRPVLSDNSQRIHSKQPKQL